MQSDEKEKSEVVPQRKKPLVRPAIFYPIIGLLLIGALAAAMIPDLAGGRSDAKAWLSVSFWLGIIAAYFFKQRGKSGWLGFFAGLILGVIISNVWAFIFALLSR